MQKLSLLLLFSFSALIQVDLAQADPVYKCKPSDDLTAYSDAPCKTAPTKKITVKDNTLDHSQMRKSKAFDSALPKPIDNSGAAAAVSVIPQSKGAGYKDVAPLSSDTGSSSNTGGGTPAVTTQPWQ